MYIQCTSSMYVNIIYDIKDFTLNYWLDLGFFITSKLSILGIHPIDSQCVVK